MTFLKNFLMDPIPTFIADKEPNQALVWTVEWQPFTTSFIYIFFFLTTKLEV